MANLFHPHEAREDNYVLGIIAAVIVSLATLAFASSAYHSGLKYVVLALSGLETQSTVLSVRDLGVLSAEERIDLGISALSHHDEAIAEIFVEFTDRDGDDVVGSFLVLEDQSAIREDDALPILYSRLDPHIFLPVRLLPDYRTDARIVLAAAVVLLLCAVGIGIVIWRWRAFRSDIRRY